MQQNANTSQVATVIGGVLALGLAAGWVVQAATGHAVSDSYIAVTSAAVGHFLSGANASWITGVVTNAQQSLTGPPAATTVSTNTPGAHVTVSPEPAPTAEVTGNGTTEPVAPVAS